MSCLGPYYIPRPPREWSRVQNVCTYNWDINSDYATIPLIGKTVPISSLYDAVALINKGNVLQYKKNSSRLTNKQVYSKIATGTWTNRTTTWATQTDKYTNPNTNKLKRVGSEWVNENGQIVENPSCQKNNSLINYSLPLNQNSSNQNPKSLPPPPVIRPNNNNTIPARPIVPSEDPNAIQDFGNLICNTTEDICTGEFILQPGKSKWHPTSDSDVPGPIKELYWEPSIQTWFPHERLTMSNSTDKWPYNAKFILPVNGFIKPV